MRKYALLALAALALVGTNVPARAADGDAIKFDVIGEVRARMDYWENYTDLNDDNHDNFSAWPYRVRVGVHGMLTENVAAHVEFQNFGTFGNEWPDKGIGMEDTSGSGDDVQVYQRSSTSTSSAATAAASASDVRRCPTAPSSCSATATSTTACRSTASATCGWASATT
jgi:hypothetical protein